VLTEEALMMLVAFAAVGLVILGVLELFWPSRPRYPVRRPPPPRPALPEVRPAPPAPTSPVERRARPGSVESERRGPAMATGGAETRTDEAAGDLVSPVARTATVAAPAVATPDAGDASAPPAAAPAEIAETVTASIADALAAVPTVVEQDAAAAGPAGGDDPMIRELARVSAEPLAVDESGAPAERCAALIDAGRFDEAIAVAETALHGSPGASEPQGDALRARLWGLLGRARQGRGDADGARAALQSAIAAAPRLERGEWERQLVALAVATARSLLGRSQETAGTEEAIVCVRGALGWLETGLALAPGDRGVRDTLTAVRAALWPTYGKAVVALGQRRDFAAARRRLREALEDEALPAARRRSFGDLLAASYGDEARHLTAEAIRAMKEGRDADAMGTLARAEDLLARVPAEGAARARRPELERRLWWSYMRLGTRRLSQGAGEDALDALFRALAFASVGAERLGETRGLLVRAYETLTETRREEVERLLERGERDAAVAAADRLAELLRGGTERGLAPDDLAEVRSRAQDVFGRLDRVE
jgi:tetratricopeptide (TPR) repeat protein